MTATDAALTQDAFLGGRLNILQPKDGYRAATDPVFLAAAVPASPSESILELGCGAGVAILCLMTRVQGLDATGVEIQALYADLARKNATLNTQELNVLEGDISAPPSALATRNFDHVIMNPPFYDPEATTGPHDAGRAQAHREGAADLSDFITLGLRRLKQRGHLTLIHRAERLGEILTILEPAAGDINVLPLAARSGRAAGRVIVQARKSARAPLRLLSPLVVHAGDAHSEGSGFTPQAEAILRNAAPLSLG